MSEKILSIITVTKNCVNTIERTLQSVKLVKSDRVEFIVVDGLSEDGTIEKIKKYSQMIDQLICEEDEGIYQAMNKGVAKAKGEFILFINGDDELIPDGVSQVISLLPTCNEQVVSATTVVVGDQYNPSFLYIPNPSKLVFWDSIPHPSSFIRRELLIKFPFREDLRIASDYDFFLKIFMAGMTFKIASYHTARHYYGGISSDIVKTKMETDLIRKANLGWWRAYYYQGLLNLWRKLSKIMRRQRISK